MAGSASDLSFGRNAGFTGNPHNMPLLTNGAIARVINQDTSFEPSLQVLCVTKISVHVVAGQSEDSGVRFCLVLSDGLRYLQGVLTSKYTHLVNSNRLRKWSVIRLKKFVCRKIAGKKVCIVLQCEVVSQLTAIIGTPQNVLQSNLTQKPASVTPRHQDRMNPAACAPNQTLVNALDLSFTKNADYRRSNIDVCCRHYTCDKIADWDKLYKEHWLISPLMAFRLSIAAVVLPDLLGDDPEIYFCEDESYVHKYEYIFLENTEWMEAFSIALERVALRLCQGLGFRPNCIAEQRAVVCIIDYAWGSYVSKREIFNTSTETDPNFRATRAEYPYFEWLEKNAKTGEKDSDFDRIMMHAETTAPCKHYKRAHPQKWFLAFDNCRQRLVDHAVHYGQQQLKGITRNKLCVWCLKAKSATVKLFRCKACHCASAIYCGRHCQKQHWKKQHWIWHKNSD